MLSIQWEQCRTCLIGEDLGDDRHLANHISAKCQVIPHDELKAPQSRTSSNREVHEHTISMQILSKQASPIFL